MRKQPWSCQFGMPRLLEGRAYLNHNDHVNHNPYGAENRDRRFSYPQTDDSLQHHPLTIPSKTTATTTQTLITPPTPTNLWQNPSFEAPLPASSLFLAQCTTGCDVSLSPTSHTGLLGLRLLGLRLLVTSTGQKAGVVQTFTTTSPSRYLFSFWYRVDGPVVPDARLNYWIDYEQVQFFSGGELSTEWRLAGPFEVGGGGGVWERQCGGDHDGGEI